MGLLNSALAVHMKALLVISCVCFVQATKYDVTTVYRLTDYPLHANETAKDVASGCFVGIGGDGCENWQQSGWTPTDSGLFGVTFPSTVVQKFIPDATNTTSKITLPPYEDFDSNTSLLDVSINFASPESEDKITFVFATEENDEIADLIVLKTSKAKRTHAAYRCLSGQGGRLLQLPGGAQRMCSSIASQHYDEKLYDASADNYRVSMEPSRLTIRYLNSRKTTILDLRSINQLKDLKYLSVAVTGSVTFSTPSNVLQLTAMTGKITSPSQTKANKAHLCVTFSAFLHPLADASLQIYAEYAGGRTLEMGVVTGSTNDSTSENGNSDKEAVESRVWKFVKFVDPSVTSSYVISIEADKLRDHPVLIGDISFCEEDVLVEVHARTNARGMPFKLLNGTNIEPNIGITVPPFHAEDNKHGWLTENWERFMSNISTPFDQGLTIIEEYTSGSNCTKAIRPTYDRPVQFRFVPKNIQQPSPASVMQILLYVNNPVKNIKDQSEPMYIVRIHGQYYRHGSENVRILKCTSNDQQQTYNIHSNLQRNCREMYRSQVESSYRWYEKVVQRNDVKFTAKKGHIMVKVDDKLIIDWTDPQPLDIKQFGFATMYMEGEFKSNFNNVSKLIEESGTMTSPDFVLTTKTICMVLDYHSEDGGTVEVSAHVSYNGIDLPVASGKLESSMQYDERHLLGWKHDMYTVELPSQHVDMLGRIVVKATNANNVTMLVQRIAGCNAEAPEDVHVFSKSEAPIDFSAGYDVAVDHMRELRDSEVGRSTISCAYGSRPTAVGDKCVCPAGFSGAKCDEGCGANRYGADCGGECSDTTRQCRGMLLCRPLVGCSCAPGLTGSLCDTPCREGRYGANCKQLCGSCLNSSAAGSSCDPYTGKCRQGCQPGFYPPMCYEEYVCVKSAPTLENVENTLKVTFILDDKIINRSVGNPSYYQLQYRQRGVTEWTLTTPQKLVSEGSTSGSGTVPGLRPGREYQVRVVLIDQDGNSYQGAKVPVSRINTTCTSPEKFDFDFQSESITEESFGVTWTNPFSNSTFCPVEKYELYRQMGWLWVKKEYDEFSTRHTFTDLLPSNKYQVKLRGITTLGPTSFSPVLHVKTLQAKVLDRVRDLRAHPSTTDATKLHVSWNPPENEDEASVRRYKVTYQCLRLLACPETDCGSLVGELETRIPVTVLGGLLPFSRYNVTVTAVSSSAGLPSSVQGATNAAVPSVPPEESREPLWDRTNSSLAVRWEPPRDCAGLNGYLIGYHYQLVHPDHSAPMIEGPTAKLFVNFTDLEPYTEYVAKVYAVTSSGWNAKYPLTISGKTKASADGVVRDLTVYKRGRRFLGVRWSDPRVTYGSVRHVTVSYEIETDLSGGTRITKMEAEHCKAWPELYCHTIDGLTADKKYSISVQARNIEVDEDGDKVTVRAITKESAPGAPTSLKLVDKSSTDVTIEWRLPALINGQLRTFLVNIEETDSVNATDCCENFPLKEVTVQSEELKYNFQLTDLRPASTYLVSVSAKTVSLGPSVSLTAHTRPPTPRLETEPRFVDNTVDKKGFKVRVEPTQDYQHMIGGYMLLIATNETGGAALDIYDKWLSNELNQFNETLYLVAEFTKDQLESGKVVELSGGERPKKGHFGAISLPKPTAAISYQLVQVLVLDYCGSLSMGYIRGQSFTGA